MTPNTQALLSLSIDKSIINNVTIRHKDLHSYTAMAVFDDIVRYPEAWGRNKCVLSSPSFPMCLNWFQSQVLVNHD